LEKRGLLSNKTGIVITGYAAFIGLVYIFFGLLEIISGLGISSFYTIPSDIIGGLMLIFIGLIFLRGLGELSQAKVSGISYLLVGVMMTIIYSGLFILIMGAEGIEFLIGKEDFMDWSWQYSFRPEIWLPVITIPAILFFYSQKRIINPL
jgi:hypothetical protein